MKTFFIILLFIACLPSNALAKNLYTVTVKGQHAGDADFIIEESQDHFQIVLNVFPVMLVKLFGIEEMMESAKGIIKSGHYYPAVYQRITLNGKKLLTVNFSKDQAIITHQGQTIRKNIPALSQDRLTQIAQIRYDLKHQRVKTSYLLLTEKSLHRYHASVDGHRVTLRQANNSGRSITIWFDYNYYLEKMEKRKHDKLQFRLVRKSKS